MLGNARSFLLLVSIALIGCESADQSESGYAVGFYDWGVRRGTGIKTTGFFNAVGAWRSSGEQAGAIAYLTGGEGGVTDDGDIEIARAQRPPTLIVADHNVGSVTVRIRAFSGDVINNADEDAEWIADSLRSATTEVWPRSSIPVEVDIHVMPDDAIFSLARFVKWAEGQPYSLALFVEQSRMSEGKGTAVHELYHVLTHRWSIGSKGQQATTRPNAALAFEEVAAGLYASCGALLVDGFLPRPTTVVSGTLNRRVLDFPLLGDDLIYVLDMLGISDQNPQESAQIGTVLGKYLESVPILDVFGSREMIALESAEGQQLLQTCRDISSDPFGLEPLMRGIAQR